RRGIPSPGSRAAGCGRTGPRAATRAGWRHSDPRTELLDRDDPLHPGGRVTRDGAEVLVLAGLQELDREDRRRAGVDLLRALAVARVDRGLRGRHRADLEVVRDIAAVRHLE